MDAKLTMDPATQTTGSSESRQRSVSVILCLALALFTAAIYWPVRQHAFIVLDDPDYVLTNPAVQAGVTPATLRWAFTESYAGNWHPVTWVSHMIDCRLFGLKPGGHHLVNVAFHVVNSVLLFLLLQRMTKARWRSAFIAALFALHPLHVESVAWISERKDVLSAFFFLLTIGAYVRYVEAKTRTLAGGKVASTAAGKKWFAIALVLFALGLMSKPMLVTLPFVLLLLDFWPLARSHRGNEVDAAGKHPPPHVGGYGWRQLIIEKIPFFVLVILVCVITVAAQPIAGVEGFPVVDRFSNSLTAYLGYITKMFWPLNLSVYYPFPAEPDFAFALLALVLLVAITIVAVRSAKKRPYLLVGWLWYLGMLVPVIGWIQVGSQSMADRYTYLPLVGLFIMIAWGAAEVLSGREQRRPAIAAAGAVAVAACGVLASKQIAHWRDSGTLFNHAATVDERNYMAWSILGDLMRVDGRFADAQLFFDRAISLRPNSEVPWYGLALCRNAMHQPAEAEQAFQEALKRNPNNAHVLSDYAEFLVNLGRLDEAQAELDKARRANPHLVGPRIAQMLLFQKQRRLNDAISECKEILRLEPANEFVRIRLASIYSVLGDANNAVAVYRDVVRSNPTNANARVGLGLALIELRDLAAAEAEFVGLLQNDPKNPSALDGLGFVLAQKGQLDEAKAKFSESLQLNPTNALTHLHYAMCLTSQDQAREAIAEYRKALELDPDRVVALNNLAWALASHPDAAIRNGKEAVELAERACQLTNNRQPFYLGTLAAAYAEAGRFDDAIATGEKARDLANEFGWKELADRNEQLLRYYHVHQPFRQPAEKPVK